MFERVKEIEYACVRIKSNMGKWEVEIEVCDEDDIDYFEVSKKVKQWFGEIRRLVGDMDTNHFIQILREYISEKGYDEWRIIVKMKVSGDVFEVIHRRC